MAGIIKIASQNKKLSNRSVIQDNVRKIKVTGSKANPYKICSHLLRTSLLIHKLTIGTKITLAVDCSNPGI
jgi:hypothetical protein